MRTLKHIISADTDSDRSGTQGRLMTEDTCMNIIVVPQYKPPPARYRKAGRPYAPTRRASTYLSARRPPGILELAVDEMAFEDYLTANEAAQRLHVHPETVKRLCRQGDLRAEKVRNTWLIHSDVLDVFAGTYDSRPGARKRVV